MPVQLATLAQAAQPGIPPPLFLDTTPLQRQETQFRATHPQMLMHRHIRNLSQIPTHTSLRPLRTRNLTLRRMPRRTQDRPTLVHRRARTLEARRSLETQSHARNPPPGITGLEVLQMVLAISRSFMCPGPPHGLTALVPPNRIHTATQRVGDRQILVRPPTRMPIPLPDHRTRIQYPRGVVTQTLNQLPSRTMRTLHIARIHLLGIPRLGIRFPIRPRLPPIRLSMVLITRLIPTLVEPPVERERAVRRVQQVPVAPELLEPLAVWAASSSSLIVLPR